MLTSIVGRKVAYVAPSRRASARDEAEAAREIRHHFAMFDQPAIDLGAPEVEDRTTDGELRVVYSHRAPRPRAGAR